jgi:hypothetical protein
LASWRSTRADKVVPLLNRTVTDARPWMTWTLVSKESGPMKKPVPRALPASISATAGSATLMISSTESERAMDGGAAGGSTGREIASDSGSDIRGPAGVAGSTRGVAAGTPGSLRPTGVSGSISAAVIVSGPRFMYRPLATPMPTSATAARTRVVNLLPRSASTSTESADTITSGSTRYSNPHRHCRTEPGTRRSHCGQVQLALAGGIMTVYLSEE